MGGAVSNGLDNDSLIDNLMSSHYIKTPIVERVFRAVDRAFYFVPEFQDNAYKDLAWKSGNLHLSAPCVYSEVMENLCLEPGMSFLNLGSGTGYFSTMAGLILGPYGLNHGIEIHEDVIQYAYKKLEEFKRTSGALDSFDFCEPSFVKGNSFCLNSLNRLYDRVYCGAACPANLQDYVINLIKVDGILVVPLDEQLLKITRISENEWERKVILPVSFATLQVPESIHMTDLIMLPESEPMLLQEACRTAIRRLLRVHAERTNPELCKERPRKPAPPKRKRPLQLVIPIMESSDEDVPTEVMLASPHLGTMINIRRAVAVRRRLLRSHTRNSDNDKDREENEDASDESIDGVVVSEEENVERENCSGQVGNIETASQQRVRERDLRRGFTQQGKKLKKREKFDSGIGDDEMENEEGSSSDSALSILDTETDMEEDAIEKGITGTRITVAQSRYVNLVSHDDDEDEIDDVITNWIKSPTNTTAKANKSTETANTTASSIGESSNDKDELTYGKVMRKQILTLPLPHKLKQYLNLDRQF